MELKLTTMDGTATKTLEGLEAVAMKAIVKGMVQRQIMCEVNGQILDVRTAVALFNRAGTDVIAVVSPQGWAERKPALVAHMPGNWVWNWS